MDSKSLSVLVTGSSGFIGRHVVRHLHEAGHKVMGLDQMPPPEPLPEGVRFYACDIRQGMLPNQTFDAVVHLAALAGVRPSMDRKLDYEMTNVIGTIRLLEHCRRMGTPHFVFASSSSVYGSDTPLPAEESATPDPCNPYALTKPADVPETLASLERVGRELGWAPRISFPDVPFVAETGNLERSPGTFSR